MKKLLIAIVVAALAIPTFSKGVIRNIDFIGLKRTKKTWLLENDSIHKYIGMYISNFEKNELETTLHDIGLFSEIEIKLLRVLSSDPNAGYDDEYDERDYEEELTNEDIEADATLRITVKEKWSLIPLPFIAGNNDGVLGGFVFMDTNAFGIHDTFMAMGMGSEVRQMAMVMYMRGAKSPTKPGFMVNANFSNHMPDFSDFKDNEIASIYMLKAGAVGSLVGKIPGGVGYSVGLGYNFTGFYNSRYDAMHVNSLKLSLSKSWNKWNGWFMESSGLGASLSVGLDWGNLDHVEGEASAHANFMFNPHYPRMTFNFSLSGAMSFNRPIVNILGKNSVGSQIVHNDFATDRALNAKFTWETGLVRIKFMTLSLFASYEFFMSANVKFDKSTQDPLDIASRNKFEWTSGPGVGIKIYINQITMPALMVGYFHNVNQNKPRFGFSVGMSF